MLKCTQGKVHSNCHILSKYVRKNLHLFLPDYNDLRRFSESFNSFHLVEIIELINQLISWSKAFNFNQS